MPKKPLRLSRIIWSAPAQGITIALGALSGLFGLSLVFSDLGPGETALFRILTGVCFFCIAGLLLGFFNPRAWPVALLPCWGPCLFGLMGLVVGRHEGFNWYALLILAGPLLIAAAGGLAGRAFAIRARKGLDRALPDGSTE